MRIKLPEGAQTFLVSNDIITIYGRNSGNVLVNWKVKKEELKTVLSCLENQLGAECNETEKFRKERTKRTRIENRKELANTYEVYERQTIALCDFKKFLKLRNLNYDDFMITKTVVTNYNGSNRKTFNFKFNENRTENEQSKTGTGIKGNVKFTLERYADRFVSKDNFKMALMRTKKYKFEDFIVVEK